jgi:hypothetical protein
MSRSSKFVTSGVRTGNWQLAFDLRIRQRKELERLALTPDRHEELDFFVRLTWGRTIR